MGVDVLRDVLLGWIGSWAHGLEWKVHKLLQRDVGATKLDEALGDTWGMLGWLACF